MAAADTQALRRTPLYDRHVAAGARLVPFAGWELPVQYTGIREEHLAVRSDAGVFDVSHMGEIETVGAEATRFVQKVLSNDVAKLAVGGAQYSVICRDDGGILDDVFSYRLADDRYLTVTNSANHDKDFAWFAAHAGDFDVELADRHADYAMLAVQGPHARAIVERLADAPLPTRFHTQSLRVAGAPSLVCGTGYTGEDGVELLFDPADAATVWDALLAGGARPAGLGARDTLRLEVCYPLYGNDLMESRGPIAANLGWCCKENTGFIGAEAVRAVRERGPAELLVPFMIEGPGIARQGNPVIGGGEVTSGTLSPSLEAGIGLAYLPVERSKEGTEIEIDVRGRRRRAVVKAKPLLRLYHPYQRD